MSTCLSCSKPAFQRTKSWKLVENQVLSRFPTCWIRWNLALKHSVRYTANKSNAYTHSASSNFDIDVTCSCCGGLAVMRARRQSSNTLDAPPHHAANIDWCSYRYIFAACVHGCADTGTQQSGEIAASHVVAGQDGGSGTVAPPHPKF